MKFLTYIVTNLIAAFLTVTVLLTVVALISVVIANGFGLLFGFEKPSPGCDAYISRTQTNLEYYTLPIASYACKENAGLLQPAVKDALGWLEARHK